MNLRDPALAGIVERAADWIGRHDAGLSPTEAAELDRWLAADWRHREAYNELERCSQALDRLSAFRTHNSTTEAADHLHQGRRLGWRPTWAWPLAAAAVLAVCSAVGWQSLRARNFSGTLATKPGESRRFSLPDGSRVLLNTNSHVAVAYEGGRRSVELIEGEAHFTVAKNARRPFVVRVGEVDVRAVGTAFNVRRRHDTVDVLVTEGRVDVQDTQAGRSILRRRNENGPAVAMAGERVIVAGATENPASPPIAVQHEAVSAGDVARHLAWHDRRLQFDPTPLEQVVAEFNRHSTTRLVVADPRIARLSVGGTFEIDDADTLLRLLGSSFDITWERRGQEIALRRKDPIAVAPAP